MSAESPSSTTNLRKASGAGGPARAGVLSASAAVWLLSSCGLIGNPWDAGRHGGGSVHDGSADLAPDASPTDGGAAGARGDGGRQNSAGADGGVDTGLGGTNEAGVSGVGGFATCASPSADDAWDGLAPSAEFTSDLLAFAPDNIWAAGLGIRHWNGAFWQTAPAPPRLDRGKLHGSGSNDLWYATDTLGFIFHFDGVSWTNLTPALPGGRMARQIQLWSIAPDRAWALLSSQQVVDGGLSPIERFLFQWDGSAWSAVPSPAPPTSIWGAVASDVWATTGNSMMHWDGVGWKISALPSATPSSALTVSSVWGTAAGDVWAVGGDGAQAHAWHYGGVAWTETVLAAPAFTMLWGSCPTNFYASPGSGNVIWRFDGATWKAVSLPKALVLTSIAGSGVDDVWLVESSFAPSPTATLHWRRGACGDGVVQPAAGEMCDVLGGSVFCTSRCQVNSNCEGCRNQFCGSPCGGLGPDEERKCHLLDACLARIFFGCVFNSPLKSAVACYCSDATCSMGANGPCVAAFEDAASSHDPAEVLRQIGDPQSMVGIVSKSAACMASGGAACGRFCSMQ